MSTEKAGKELDELIFDATPGTRSFSRPEHEVVVRTDVMVELPDGVRLATDCYFPARAGKPLPGSFPVVLHRTPYDKAAVERRWGYGEFFARRGYVAVIQDVRGCFGSTGEMAFALHEAEDGAAVARWLEAQPWCSGEVGSWGTSYSSFTQLAMATRGCAVLKAMVPNQSASDAWSSAIRQGGAFELRFFGWNIWHATTNIRRGADANPLVLAAMSRGAPTTGDWLTRLPIRPDETQLQLLPSYARWVETVMTETDYTEFWQQPGLAPLRYLDQFPKAEVLLTGGWYDAYARSVFELYEGFVARGRRPRLLVGPWVHGTGCFETRVAGDVDFGEQAALPSAKELHLRWFDAALKHEDTGLSDEATVRIFVMGGGTGMRTAEGRLTHSGRWRDEAEWPIARTRLTSFYLLGNGSLATSPSHAEAGSTTYRFDPAHPVPTIGGSLSSLADVPPLPALVADSDAAGGAARFREIVPPGGFDQVESADVFGATAPYLPLASRPDVCCFRTSPLEKDLEVTGPVEVRLFVSSSAPDTDFTAKLIDEYPPNASYPLGYALNLTDGICRLRYHSGRTASLVPAGNVTQLVIHLAPTSNLFVAGHRIRLDISSSNFPRFDVNPNTGGPLGRDRRRLPADNTVFHDGARPSHVVLPVIMPW